MSRSSTHRRPAAPTTALVPFDMASLGGGGVGGSTTCFIMTTTSDGSGPTTPPKPKRERVRVHVQFLIDASGSMSGSKYTAALEGAKEVLTTLINKDSAGLSVFGSSLRTIVPLAKLKTNRARIISSIEALLSEGARDGSTQLYNSIKTLTETFATTARPTTHAADGRGPPPMKAYNKELVVLTDGADNAASEANSKATCDFLHEARKRLQLQQFHVSVIAVGLSASDRANMDVMVRGIGKVFPVENSKDAIKAVFRNKIQKGIAKRVASTTTTVFVHTHSGGGGGSAPDMTQLSKMIATLGVGAGVPLMLADSGTARSGGAGTPPHTGRRPAHHHAHGGSPATPTSGSSKPKCAACSKYRCYSVNSPGGCHKGESCTYCHCGREGGGGKGRLSCSRCDRAACHEWRAEGVCRRGDGCRFCHCG